jgi:formamidopyrimidine-DNA glycosylase
LLIVPELVEIEIYRRQAEALIGRTIESVTADDQWYLKGATSSSGLIEAVAGSEVVDARRIGKLLLLDLHRGRKGGRGAQQPISPTLGLRFGMTGRLVVDGDAAIEELLYSTGRQDPAFERFSMRLVDGGSLIMVDPRRLGGVELGPDESRLGPDAATVTSEQLGVALAKSSVALKARLLDQVKIAGIGNLIADETLWRGGFSPVRTSSSLSADEVHELAKLIRATIRLLLRRGGSHMGDLQDQRSRDGVCPRDGSPLLRRSVGGRTTYWCSTHQQWPLVG